MAFYPEVNQKITIFGDDYAVMPHPLVADVPYGQEGRQAIVYCLSQQGDRNGKQLAIKVFKPAFQSQRFNKLARDLTPLAQIPGLSVCHRTVLTAENSDELLSQYPDLTNAMLMPWILGPTWVDILLDQKELSRSECYRFALSLAGTLADMEQMGIAHCDLSAANILLPALAVQNQVMTGTAGLIELVDVEQIYSQQFEQPEALPGGSPGYAHREAGAGLWAATADRFAGAVLLGEILGWCDKSVRDEAWGESYFDPAEMHKRTPRYNTLKDVLQKSWGGPVAYLFSRAWDSGSLSGCPSFAEWRTKIKGVRSSEEKPKIVQPAPVSAQSKFADTPLDNMPPEVSVLIQLADRLSGQGNHSGAIEAFTMAAEIMPRDLAAMNIIRRKIAESKAANKSVPGQGAKPADAALNHYLIRAGNRAQDKIPISKDLFIIGRSQSADHIVMDSGVSRIHMEFIRVQNRLAVRDLNSTNGTYINGQRLEPYAINYVKKGDRIKLAGVEYEFGRM